jgi:hypothetical protein
VKIVRQEVWRIPDDLLWFETFKSCPAKWAARDNVIGPVWDQMVPRCAVVITSALTAEALNHE